MLECPSDSYVQTSIFNICQSLLEYTIADLLMNGGLALMSLPSMLPQQRMKEWQSLRSLPMKHRIFDVLSACSSFSWKICFLFEISHHITFFHQGSIQIRRGGELRKEFTRIRRGILSSAELTMTAAAQRVHKKLSKCLFSSHILNILRVQLI